MVLGEANLHASTPQAQLCMRQVWLEVPRTKRGVCDRYNARLGLRLINNRCCDVMTGEAIAQHWNEIRNDDLGIVDDAHVVKLYAGRDRPYSHGCATCKGKRNNDHDQNPNSHELSPMVTNYKLVSKLNKTWPRTTHHGDIPARFAACTSRGV